MTKEQIVALIEREDISEIVDAVNKIVRENTVEGVKDEDNAAMGALVCSTLNLAADAGRKISPKQLDELFLLGYNLGHKAGIRDSKRG